MISYLQVESLSKSFGDLVLFEDLSLSISANSRVGLIAKNGAGKTTLLNIIAGREDYQGGSVTFRRDIRVAYLEQDPKFPVGSTVLEACFMSDSPTVKAIAAYEKAVGQENTEALEQAMNMMDQLNAWNYESDVKQILTKLKITNFNQLTEQLSGGQIKRIALANALITEPDLLILDEPTNHLDLEMTEWLEQHLASSKLSLLMVTHDRYFLDRVCTDIIEIDDRHTYSYQGSYTSYLEKREERINSINAQRDSDQNLYRKEIEWMRRMPQARATKAKARIESFYDLEQRLKREREAGRVQLDIKASYIGTKIFEAQSISKSYGEKVILKNFSYLFSRYEKMGIVGRNGSGKSTFIKMLMGHVQPDSGVIDLGETVNFGYYSQDGISFDENAKVIDVVTDIAENIELGDGRKMTASQFLQLFLFAPKTQHNFVARLSGGERRRLYLCTILMRNPNFLVLDEPTNDLDIMTLQVLEEYLRGYSGCLIVVSHDRYFMDKVTDHLLVFRGDGEIKDFPGSYSDYIEWQALKDAQESASGGSANSISRSAGTNKKGEASNQIIDGNSHSITSKSDIKSVTSSQKRKLSFNEKREFESIELKLPALETEKAQLEEQMSSGTLTIDELTAKSVRVSEIIAQIDDLSMRWLELSEIE